MNSLSKNKILALSLTTAISLATTSAIAQTDEVLSFGSQIVDAVDAGKTEQVNSLLSSGVSANEKGEFGTTPLMRAAYHGNDQMAKILLKKGANPNFTDVGGATPLSIAARQGNLEVVKTLIRAGAVVNTEDNEGFTPLMRATSSGSQDVAAVLIEAGAKINEANDYGETAFSQAVNNNDSALAEFLQSKGASPEVRKSGKEADIVLDFNHKADRAYAKPIAPLAKEKATYSVAALSLVEKTPEALMATGNPKILTSAYGNNIVERPEAAPRQTSKNWLGGLEQVFAASEYNVAAVEPAAGPTTSGGAYLDLGAFKTQSFADKKISDLKSDYPEVFGKLDLKTTQKGTGASSYYIVTSDAISSASDASAICKKLIAAGVNCRQLDAQQYSNELKQPTAQPQQAANNIPSDTVMINGKPDRKDVLGPAKSPVVESTSLAANSGDLQSQPKTVEPKAPATTSPAVIAKPEPKNIVTLAPTTPKEEPKIEANTELTTNLPEPSPTTAPAVEIRNPLTSATQVVPSAPLVEKAEVIKMQPAKVPEKPVVIAAPKKEDIAPKPPVKEVASPAPVTKVAPVTAPIPAPQPVVAQAKPQPLPVLSATHQEQPKVIAQAAPAPAQLQAAPQATSSALPPLPSPTAVQSAHDLPPLPGTTKEIKDIPALTPQVVVGKTNEPQTTPEVTAAKLPEQQAQASAPVAKPTPTPQPIVVASAETLPENAPQANFVSSIKKAPSVPGQPAPESSDTIAKQRSLIKVPVKPTSDATATGPSTALPKPNIAQQPVMPPASEPGKFEVARPVKVEPELMPTSQTQIVVKSANATKPVAAKENIGNRELWVRVDYFNDPQAASYFWNQKAASNPAFSGYHLRTVSPLTNLQKYSAEIGPFYSYAEAQQVCNVVTPEQLRCTVKSMLPTQVGNIISRRDNNMQYHSNLRVSNSYYGVRGARHSNLYNSGYSNVAYNYGGPSSSIAASNWSVQLGSYSSREEAEARWRGFASNPALRGTVPNIVETGGRYRLRTGNYSSSTQADRMCQKLRNTYGSCIVVRAQ